MATNQVLGRHAIELAISRIRAASGTVPPLPAIEFVWTSHNRWPEPLLATQAIRERPLYVSVLDSSFNPPTLAHLALATSEFPSLPIIDDEVTGFDAHLLLLSIRNADKSLKPTDATMPQRVEMMILMAQEMIRRGTQNQPNGLQHPLSSLGNVAVGIIDEPTMAGKSAVLLQYLSMANAQKQVASPSSHETPLPAYRLSFLVGYDTLVRVFAPKFYASEDRMKQVIHQLLSSPTEGGDGSYLICARREESLGVYKGSTPADEKAFLELEYVKPHAASHAIKFIDINEPDRMISSSQVRAGIAGRSEGASDWQRLCLPSITSFLQREDLYTAIL